MNPFERKSTSQRVSRLNVSPVDVDIRDAQNVGRAFFALLYRVLRIGTIRDPEHEQTQEAIGQLVELLEHIRAETSETKLVLEIAGELARVNGTALDLKPNEQRRLGELRSVYNAAGVRSISIGLDAGRNQIERFVRQLRRVANTEHTKDLDSVEIDSIRVVPGSTDRSLERALEGISTATYAGHLYTRLLVKIRALHRRLQREPDGEYRLRPFRRMLREITRLFRERHYAVLGLPAQNLLAPSRATHSVHAAVYAAFTALRAGTPTARASAIGTAILLEDVAAIRGYLRASPEQARAIGLDEESAPLNITAADDGIHIAAGSTGAALADVLLYERGGSRSDALGPPLYSTERPPHAAAGLVDIVRFYDAEIQGRRGDQRISPPEAIERVAGAAGGMLDEGLASFFARSMGRFPVGSCVRLSTGHIGIVVAPPSPGDPPARPTVRPFDYLDRTVDLSAPNRSSISIEGVARMPEDDEFPSAASLLIRPTGGD